MLVTTKHYRHASSRRTARRYEIVPFALPQIIGIPRRMILSCCTLHFLHILAYLSLHKQCIDLKNLANATQHHIICSRTGTPPGSSRRPPKLFLFASVSMTFKRLKITDTDRRRFRVNWKKFQETNTSWKCARLDRKRSIIRWTPILSK